MAQLITREELALVLDEDISPERFEALYTQARRIVATGYADPESATGQAAEIVSGVLFGVAIRVASNPKGTRQLTAGGAGLTFGGTDDAVAHIFSLNEDERADLAEASRISLGAPSRQGAFSIRPGA